MALPRFVQIHTLHSYPAALLNRDDSGLAKRLPFGGATRTRVSSQCLKRHWRVADDEFSLLNIDGSADVVRSRNVVERRVMEGLDDKTGASEDVVRVVEQAFQIGVYGDKGDTEGGRQPLLLGLPEVEYLRRRASTILTAHPMKVEEAGKAATAVFKEERNNFKAFRENATMPGGLVGALFGRMVTSDPGANIDAAVHVAHAFTVHPEESESDYFSVVDDLQADDEDPGAAHIGDMELTAGLFYGYVVVDVPGLVSNLTGCRSDDWQSADRELAAKVVEHLVHLIATVSPGAKLGSTAPYAYANLVLVEAGSRQPRSLANAFRKPVEAQVDVAAQAMSCHLSKLDDAYGVRDSRRVMSLDSCDIPSAERLNLDDLASWAAAVVRSGQAS